MSETVAIIDLGSNTFHLLIAEIGRNNKFTEIAKKRIYVGLGDGGIQTIKPEAIVKGIQALEVFKNIMAEHLCTKFMTIGTAALRTASNSREFLDKAETLLQQKITIIDGKLEAQYIYDGVSLITDMSEGVTVIMDIGGGSTEFIVVKDNDMIWSKSYMLGVGVLHAGWHHSDPITADDLDKIRIHIQQTLIDLREILDSLPGVKKMVGASGSFEVLESMNGLDLATNSNHAIELESCKAISEKVIKSSYEERLKMEGLPQERAKLIVVAMVLIEEALKSIQPNYLEVCPYALKEGVLSKIC